MASLKPYFKVDLSPRTKLPLDQEVDSIWRSYVVMLLAIGILGILLPVVLVIGDWIILSGSAATRGSLSAYYFSSMQDYFVATLVIVSFCLIIYRIFDHALENTLSFVAGIAALGVAFFPTKTPCGQEPTGLQQFLGQDETKIVHYICALVLFGLVAVMSVLFGLREGGRHDRPKFVPGPHPSARTRKAFHWVCAAVVVAGVLFTLASLAFEIFGIDLLVGESAALIAFGISWTYAGLEWDTLNPSLKPRPD